MRKSIAIDMDGVIADTETQFINWYERDYGVKIHPQDILGFKEDEMFPDKTAARKFAFTPGFFRTLPVMPGAVDALKKLMENFDVYIASAAMEFPQSLPEKHAWLQEHFPFISWHNIIFCGDKSIIGTDFLVDDHVKNLDFFKGKSVMFHAFHNVNFNHHQRVKTWEDAVILLETHL